MVLRRLIFPVFLSAVLAAGTAGFYYREFIINFGLKNNLAIRLSKGLGAEVAIGRLKSDIFGKTVVRNVSCKFGDYEISLEVVEASKKAVNSMPGPEQGYENIVKLRNGSLRLSNGLILSDNINGSIKLRKDKIILEDITCRLFSMLEGKVYGNISTVPDKAEFTLNVTAYPFTGKDKKGYGIKFNISGDQSDMVFNGHIFIADQKPLTMNGRASFSDDTLSLSCISYAGGDKENSISSSVTADTKNRSLSGLVLMKEGKIIVAGDYSNWPIMDIKIRNEHVSLFNTDISGAVDMSVKWVEADKGIPGFDINISTDSTIVNFYPFEELKASLWLDKDILKIKSMQFSNTLSASGAISCSEKPAQIFISFDAKDFDTGRLIFILTEQTPVFSGKVSGRLVFEGTMDKLACAADIRSASGYLGNMDYQEMILHAKGELPLLSIYDSRIIRENSFFAISGDIDINKISRDGIIEQLNIETDSKTFIWEGWDVTNTGTDGDFKIEKGVSGRVKVGFSKPGSDETRYQPAEEKQEFGLECGALDKDSAFQIKYKENEEFFGVVKKHKF